MVSTPIFMALAGLLAAVVGGLALLPLLRAGKRGVWGTLVAAMVVATLGLYQWLGTPAALQAQSIPVPSSLAEGVEQLQEAMQKNPDRIDGWVAGYHARALAAGLPVPAPERFRRDLDLIGVQRHLKVIGIFARLHYRDHKPRYLTDVPRFFAYLDAVLPRHAALAGLRHFIAARVQPALAERAARQGDAPA